MKQTAPRCLLCGENPRIMHERHEGLPTYAPLCEECYLESIGRRPGEERIAPAATKKVNLPELLVIKARYIALGLSVASILQLPAMFLTGTNLGVIVDSFIIAISVPLAASGFWVDKMNRSKP